MSIQRAEALIEQLAIETLKEAFEEKLISNSGSFLLGDERLYAPEFEDKPEPHIVMYRPIARRSSFNAPIGMQCVVGFYDRRSVEDHNSRAIAEIQYGMEALWHKFQKKLENYAEPDTGAPLAISDLRYETTNKNYIFLGTGVATSFQILFTPQC